MGNLILRPIQIARPGRYSPHPSTESDGGDARRDLLHHEALPNQRLCPETVETSQSDILT